MRQLGLKHDSDKLPYHLIPLDALEEVVKVLRYGQQKYGDRNWEKGMLWHRPYAALLRHILVWWRGEDIDKESGLPHLAHVSCCALFLLTYSIREKLKKYDDRISL